MNTFVPNFILLLVVNSFTSKLQPYKKPKQKWNNPSSGQVHQQQSIGQGGQAKVAWFWFGKESSQNCKVNSVGNSG